MEEVLFENAAHKLGRACEHLNDLEREVLWLKGRKPYAEFSETHLEEPSHQIYKVKMTEPIPAVIGDLIGDIVGGLRSSLDHCCNTVAQLAGHINPQNATFPFAASEDSMGEALSLSSDLPEEIQSILLAFKPYRGGNDSLWALNELCHTDRHRMIVPVVTSATRNAVRFWAKGVRFSIPREHAWDVAKNEMELFTIHGPGVEGENYNRYFNFTFNIAFGDIDVVGGQEVIPTLDALGGKVQDVLVAIQDGARKIGLIPETP